MKKYEICSEFISGKKVNDNFDYRVSLIAEGFNVYFDLYRKTFDDKEFKDEPSFRFELQSKQDILKLALLFEKPSYLLRQYFRNKKTDTSYLNSDFTNKKLQAINVVGEFIIGDNGKRIRKSYVLFYEFPDYNALKGKYTPKDYDRSFVKFKLPLCVYNVLKSEQMLDDNSEDLFFFMSFSTILHSMFNGTNVGFEKYKESYIHEIKGSNENNQRTTSSNSETTRTETKTSSSHTDDFSDDVFPF